MKKLLAIILITTLLFTGCGKKPEMLKVYEFNGLKWGSSVAECLSILGMTENDVIVEKDDGGLPHYVVQTLNYDTKIYGKNAVASLVFIDDCLDTGISLGLSQVRYRFKEKVEGKEWVVLVNADIKAQGLETKEPAFPEVELLVVAENQKTIMNIENSKLKKRSIEICETAFPARANSEGSEEMSTSGQMLVKISRLPKVSEEEKLSESLAVVEVDGINAAVVQYAINNPS